MRKLDELFVKASNFLDSLLDLRGRLDARAEEAHGGAEKAFFGGDGDGAGAFDAFDQNLDVAVGEFDTLDDIGEGADGVNFFGLGVIDGGVVLRGQENLFVAGERLFQSANAGFAADDERRHLLREDDHVAHRHHWHALDFLFFSIEH